MEMIFYRVGSALATLCAGLALLIGYRKAYLLDTVLGIGCLFFSMRLKEVPVSGDQFTGKISSRVAECFRESFSFLRHNLRAEGLMLWNAFVGALATLLVFFLQAQLPLAGLSRGLLGPALFLMGLGGAVGSRLVLHLSGWSYQKVSVLCIAGIGVSLLLGVSGIPVIMCFGGFFAPFFDDLLQVRSDALLNGMFPSSQRATLISVSSLCFSLVMIVLSPLAGSLFGALGN